MDDTTALHATLPAPKAGPEKAPTSTPAVPVYAPIPGWCDLSGMRKGSTYAALGRGDLRAVKIGSRTLVDVRHGLLWLGSLPPASIRPPGAKPPQQAA